eukprot:2889241-Pleurochrysis_carterae.AAC.1
MMHASFSSAALGFAKGLCVSAAYLGRTDFLPPVAEAKHACITQSAETLIGGRAEPATCVRIGATGWCSLCTIGGKLSANNSRC